MLKPIVRSELEPAMKMHPIGHRVFHDVIRLPRFDNEDLGFYYFLAQISLRKLLTDTLDVVGYKGEFTLPCLILSCY